MRKVFFVFLLFHSLQVLAKSAVDEAVLAAGIRAKDSLSEKIDKALWLLNEQRYFYPKKPLKSLPPSYKNPYELDSMRTPEQVLNQKIGGSCGSSALAFAAMLIASGIKQDKIQVVASVVNRDLAVICPKAGVPRVDNPQSGAPGHVFVAVQLDNGNWELINSIDGSRTYERVPWYSPKDIHRMMQKAPVQIPKPAFEQMPKEIYASGLTVFQSWYLNEVPIHNFEQRFDLIASGQLKPTTPICRFTAP